MIVDPKGERGGWKETLPEIADEINILNLTSKPKNQGLQIGRASCRERV